MDKLSCLFLLFIFQISGYANSACAQQRTLGVVWELPENQNQAINELHQFQRMGIALLELREIPPERVWDELERREMRVFGNPGLSFPTAGTFNRGDSTFFSSYQRKLADFSSRPSISAINLFHYGATGDPEFNAAAHSFFTSILSGRNISKTATTTRIPEATDLPVDFFTYDIRVTPANIRHLSIPDSGQIGAYLYSPSKELRSYLGPFRTIIRQTRSSPQKPVFVQASWLLAMMRSHPQLEMIFRSITSEKEAVFPVPKEKKPTPDSSPLPVIALLLVWGSIAYHYNISPFYRKSLFRYVTSHNFFLEDIYQRHFRSAFPAIIILLQHALLFAAVSFALSAELWTTLGLKNLNFYYPNLFFVADSSYNLFVVVLSGTLLLSSLFIFWLSAFHKQIRSTIQIIILFAWPLQLNFIIGTFALAVHVSGGSMYIVTSLAILMFILFLASFLVTALDVSQILNEDRFRYLMLTSGLYAALLVASAGWIIWFADHFWEVIDLSLQLR